MHRQIFVRIMEKKIKSQMRQMFWIMMISKNKTLPFQTCLVYITNVQNVSRLIVGTHLTRNYMKFD